MEIKKLSKIVFSIAAQCNHGESDSQGGCHADCKKTKYVNSNAIFNWFWGDLMPSCSKKTVWTCSTLCCW